MTITELDHLIKMANEIASNLAQGDADAQVAGRVADHLKRFWAPQMRERLIDYQRGDGDKLLPACRLALEQLTAES